MLKLNDLKEMKNIEISRLLCDLELKEKKDYFDYQNLRTIKNYIICQYVQVAFDNEKQK